MLPWLSVAAGLVAAGLIAAVAQDAETLDVLMLAWMNPEAWEKTLETGEAHYYSRSRKCLWHKGGTSGHVQKVKSIRLDCDGDAVPLIQGDPERLKQVLLNILDNAAKYGKNGGSVAVAVKPDGADVVVTVRDHGPGIPEAELPHVKEKFYKGSSRERGSGIGLAVCEEIVVRHGGTLTVENAEGGGVCVTVRLPAKQAA